MAMFEVYNFLTKQKVMVLMQGDKIIFRRPTEKM